jgi:1-deoxy-D-xylulose-5-phosphate synthase
VFGQALLDEARRHPELVAISAAMLGPTKLTVMQQRVPRPGLRRRHRRAGRGDHGRRHGPAGAAAGLRHLLDLPAAGLRPGDDGRRPHKLPVIFVLDRSGITGEDGSSHHGVYDVTWLREIPNWSSPRPATATSCAAPWPPRSPMTPGRSRSGSQVDHAQGSPSRARSASSSSGAWDVRTRGRDVLLLGLGRLAVACEEATRLLRQDGVSVTLADPRWVKPLDPRLGAVAGAHRLVVTVEDNVLAGGFGSAVAEVLADEEVATPLLRLGIPDQFLPHGKRESSWPSWAWTRSASPNGPQGLHRLGS